MSFQAAAALVLVLLVLGLILYGALSPRRSGAIAAIALLVALLAAAGGWHAWAESGSLPWTLGYGAVAVIGATACVRNLDRKRR